MCAQLLQRVDTRWHSDRRGRDKLGKKTKNQCQLFRCYIEKVKTLGIVNLNVESQNWVTRRKFKISEYIGNEKMRRTVGSPVTVRGGSLDREIIMRKPAEREKRAAISSREGWTSCWRRMSSLRKARHPVSGKRNVSFTFFVLSSQKNRVFRYAYDPRVPSWQGCFQRTRNEFLASMRSRKEIKLVARFFLATLLAAK